MTDARKRQKFDTGACGHSGGYMRFKDIGGFAAQDKQGPRGKRIEHRPHVHLRGGALRCLERFGDLHVIIERDAPPGAQRHDALGIAQPIGDVPIRVDIVIAFLKRASGMHPCFKIAPLTNVTANPFKPGFGNLGTDVVEDGCSNAGRIAHRKQHRQQSAKRSAYRDETGDAFLRQQGFDVLKILQRLVGHRVFGIIAIAAPAHFGAQYPPFSGKMRGQIIKIAGIAREPGQANHRRAAGITIKHPEMQAQPIAAGPVTIFELRHDRSETASVWPKTGYARLQVGLVVPTIAGMQPLPQDAIYRASPRIMALADWIGDPVRAADFPQTHLRWRNDHAAADVGLDQLSDEDWVRHFGRFAPLPDNMPGPMALRYHGHQFGVYNPELGDGRGFTFAQMLDSDGRLMDFGTKGSGQTPWSRRGDGRLTLKGAVREILATEMLGALGVNTSRTFSVIETGEALYRGDEPSPTRSAVMVRLSHGHIRIGTFQRLGALQLEDEMGQLVAYCLANFPGCAFPEAPHPAVRFFNQVVERMADMAASYMVAGFVHGVLNSDNMNVTGESFDYGPWRWLPSWDPAFTAAYFDHQGLYAYGRQPEAIHWNCGQLAVALRSLVEAAPLVEALNRYPELYSQAMVRRWCWRLGIAPRGLEEDTAMIGACEAAMVAGGMGPDAFFFAHRGGRGTFADTAESSALKAVLAPYTATDTSHAYWDDDAPQAMLIDEVEAIWQPIAENDDWSALHTKVTAIRRMGEALGEKPRPAGHELA